MPSEKELLSKLAEAEKELTNTKNLLAEAKRKWTAAETNVISAKIHLDRVKEEIRIHRNTTPRNDPTPQDLDLQRFRDDHPELMEWIRERDKKKDETDD